MSSFLIMQYEAIADRKAEPRPPKNYYPSKKPIINFPNTKVTLNESFSMKFVILLLSSNIVIRVGMTRS
jgi:hypothetical protein